MTLTKTHPKAQQHVAVVGADPVGALAAIYMAQLGWKVSLYEARSGKWNSISNT